MYEIIPAAYIFTHVYLNTMQQGIQALHTAVEFFVQNPQGDNHVILPHQRPSLHDSVVDWACNHKTVRILSAGGGEQFDITMSGAKDMAKKYGLPFASFREPDNFNQIDAFGIIVTPELVADVAEERMCGVYLEATDSEDGHPLVAFLKEFHSAR